MPTILALETSTEFCSVALHVDGKIITNEVTAGQRHSEMLLPMIHELLTEAELTLQQLDGIAFGAGPGSFTGLRIACGVTQGLAYAANLPVIAISTLEAVAEKIAKNNVIVALDARMGEIYHAAYWKVADRNWKIVHSPSLCLPQHAPPVLDHGWHSGGSGFDTFHEILSTRYHGALQQTHGGLHPHAEQVAMLALEKYRTNATIHATQAAPVYIRNKVALKENER